MEENFDVESFTDRVRDCGVDYLVFHISCNQGFLYYTPDKVTEKPALTINGQVAHFSHRIFSGYYDKASVELRTVFSNVLNRLFPRPLIKTGKLPSFSRVFVTEQPGRRMAHLLSYLPEMRGNTQMIEEPVKLNNITISLRQDDQDFKNIYLAPKKKRLSYTIEEVIIDVPKSKGYSLLVIEE